MSDICQRIIWIAPESYVIIPINYPLTNKNKYTPKLTVEMWLLKYDSHTSVISLHIKASI